MEAFKSVEKEMKTKAFSKEGLLISSKQDPREIQREESREFLGTMVDELSRQIEEAEAELESLQLQTKKKKDNSKVERISEIEDRTERLKWHQTRVETLMRALANDDVDLDNVKDAQNDIQYYVENNREVDFMEDDSIYDNFDLDEEGEKYGMHNELDKVTSQEGASNADDTEIAPPPDPTKAKPKSVSESTGPARRPSQHIKSPLPALATLHNLPAATPATVNNNAATSNMKPAPPPTKPPGEMLNYRSAAAAGAANDAAGIGITPLPPPPGKVNAPLANALSSTLPEAAIKSSTASSPAVSVAQPVDASPAPSKASIPAPPMNQPLARPASKSPAPSQSSVGGPSPAVSAAQLAQASARDTAPVVPQQNGITRPNLSKRNTQSGQNHDRIASLSSVDAASPVTPLSQANGIHASQSREDESVFHLPASLQDLVDSFEEVRNNVPPVSSSEHQRMLEESFARRPDVFDSEKPRNYKPQKLVPYTPAHYPQQPLPIFDDPRLYSRVDQDALFYSFYYRQGTYQQYLAAKELKSTSWRFHKQYQTWFQRHEEPQQITEDFEKGTYRFFDYESTW